MKNTLTLKAQGLLKAEALDIANPANFAEFVSLAKKLQDQLDLAWKEVERQMEERNVEVIEGEWGTLSLAERRTWKADTQLPPRFYKSVLDSRKLAFAAETGKLPEGAYCTSTTYLSRRIK